MLNSIIFFKKIKVQSKDPELPKNPESIPHLISLPPCTPALNIIKFP